MPIMVVVLGPPVVPIDEIQVEPCLMMAALIGWSRAECFSWDGEGTMTCALSKIDENLGGLRNPQTSAQLSGMDPGPHTGVGPGGVSKAPSVMASSIVLRLSLLRHRRAVPLKSPATKSTS